MNSMLPKALLQALDTDAVAAAETVGFFGRIGQTVQQWWQDLSHEFYRNFCAALDGKAELLITPAQVRRVMQVMEAAFASDAAHQTLEVSI